MKYGEYYKDVKQDKIYKVIDVDYNGEAELRWITDKTSFFQDYNEVLNLINEGNDVKLSKLEITLLEMKSNETKS